MSLNKSTSHQSLFYILITFLVIFNGGNYDVYSQFNFIFTTIFFFYCQKDINYKSHIRKFYKENKKIFILYFIFLFYLIFQTVPLPTELLKFLSNTKYKLLSDLNYENHFSSISLDPSKTYFSFLNYFSLILYLILFKSIFYKKRHILKFYLFLSLLSFFSSSIAVYFYLIGNPNFLFISNNSYNSATGFFINRTVFACFLNIGFLASLEYLKSFDISSKINNEKYFIKIYVRLFLLFITIGIITSFSKIGNFLFLILIIIYLFSYIFSNEKKNKFIIYTLIVIIFFDIFILGFYFGGEKLIERFSFLQNELSAYTNSDSNEYFSYSRGDIAKFSLMEVNNFFYFGYGAGGFELLFKNFYSQSNINFANHAHFDLSEFLGEFGIIGFSIFAFIILLSIKKIKFFNSKNIFLAIFITLILFFDFSLHIPLIQIILILMLSINLKKTIR